MIVILELMEWCKHLFFVFWARGLVTNLFHFTSTATERLHILHYDTRAGFWWIWLANMLDKRLH